MQIINVGHGKFGKVMESHGVLKYSKSTNPAMCINEIRYQQNTSYLYLLVLLSPRPSLPVPFNQCSFQVSHAGGKLIVTNRIG